MGAIVFCIGIVGNIQVVEFKGKVHFLRDFRIECVQRGHAAYDFVDVTPYIPYQSYPDDGENSALFPHFESDDE